MNDENKTFSDIFFIIKFTIEMKALTKMIVVVFGVFNRQQTDQSFGMNLIFFIYSDRIFIV